MARGKLNISSPSGKMLFGDYWRQLNSNNLLDFQVALCPFSSTNAIEHHEKMHDGHYKKLMGIQAFRNACREMRRIIRGKMPDHQFEKMLGELVRVNASQKSDMRKERREYKRDPSLSRHIEQAIANCNGGGTNSTNAQAEANTGAGNTFASRGIQ